MPRMIRSIVVALLLTVLTMGAARAWPSATVHRPAAGVGGEVRLAAAWEWLASVFRPADPKPANRTPSRHLEKEGCGTDPWGRPVNCG